VVLARLPIRARLTVAFAAALGAILFVAGVLVYTTVSARLTGAIDDDLRSRFDEVVELLTEPGTAPPDLSAEVFEGHDGFTQVLTPEGAVLASTAPGSGSAVDATLLDRARDEPVWFGGLDVAGVEGEARVLVAPARVDGASYLVVAGASTEDRDAALESIAGAFALGAPVALVLASGLGYLLAARALSPVRAMQRRAGQITLQRSGERLPLPAAADELHALGETLNAMLDRIEAALQRERAFVADASHELRTPLTILHGELELARQPHRTVDELRAALNSAGEEVDRLTRLAEDLLVLARADQSRLAPQRAHVDVRELLGRVQGRFTSHPDGGERRVVVDAPEGLRAALDARQVEQALVNLVDNARRHGDGVVRLSARASGTTVAVEVSDSGPGFPDGFEASAFERFTRGDPSRTTDGAGLGLAIVLAIAEAHGGVAEIVSPRAPTTLRLTLPSPTVARGD
jgi:two-component system, OmpR family, sensor kinase